MKILLCGSTGRMGSVVRRIAEEKGHGIVPLPRTGTWDAAELDVAIDFSQSAGTIAAAKAAMAKNIPLISGTTSLDDAARTAIAEAAVQVPVVQESNFSLGVYLLMRALDAMAKDLPQEFSADVLEMHHRHKRDAPSGTAKELAKIIGQGMHNAGPVNFHSIRGGEICGIHEVRLIGEGEWISLTHSALDRSIYANGALRIAELLVRHRREMAPGRYGLEELCHIGGGGTPFF
ncbi:MAG: 4-hydroxy-tetrahydrodipicolinate reductase [Puniceicoccales bacterium]|jgi:4-hydroxy-tetrahydrodipicolinate reductase|nr:4-hydroxy-tetrahydrodipicolinate reductase [Puniceicoccales bacterium]